MLEHEVGLIGCGWVAPFHLAGLTKLDSRVRVAWVADPDKERAQRTADQAGATALTDYREGLQDVDCAFVLVPHHLHLPVTLDCLKAGCHVLLEKPMARTVEEADEMIAAAKSSNKTLMVGYPHRYRRSMQLFKQIILSGRYGKLFMLDGLMDESLHNYTLGWIAKKETLGGGVFFSASPHMLDVMLWIAGPVRTISMVGTHGASNMEGEDTAVSIMKFENGVVGVTRHTWASPKSRVWYTIHAFCQKAHVILTTTPLGDLVREGSQCRWSTRIVALGEDQEEILFENDEGLDFFPEIQHFFECVETGRTPQTDGSTAREIIRLVQDAYGRAAQEGGNS
jgi:predicted dehydrogenase